MVRPKIGNTTSRSSRPTAPSVLLTSRSTKPPLTLRTTARPSTTTPTTPTASATLTFTSTPPPHDPSRLLATHRSLLQLRTDIAQLTHSDTLIKTKIRQVEKRIMQCKALHAQLALLPNLPPPTSSPAPPHPPPIAALIARKRTLTTAIANLDSLAVTHTTLVQQTELEGKELIELHSDLQRLQVEQRRRAREREEGRLAGKERVERLRLEKEEWVERGEVMRAECVRVEEELEREETRQRQLRRALEGKAAATSRLQRAR